MSALIGHCGALTKLAAAMGAANDPLYDEVVVFLAGEDLTDSGPWDLALTAGSGVSLSSTSPAFGTQSIEFDGTANATLDTVASAALDLGTSDFTIEFQLTPLSISGLQVVYTTRPASSDRGVFVFMDGDKLRFFCYDNTGAGFAFITSSATLAIGVTQQCSIIRNGPDFEMYFGTTLVGFASTATAIGAAAGTVGKWGYDPQVSGRWLYARLDQFRITLDVRVPTIQTEPFPDFYLPKFRYWRFTAVDWMTPNGKNQPGSLVRVAEWELLSRTNTYPKVNMSSDSAPSPLAASASSIEATTVASAYYAFDGNLGDYNRWMSADLSDNEQWLQIDLGQRIRPDTFKIAPDGGVAVAPNGNYIKAFRIEGSDTGLFAGEQQALLTVTGLTQSDWTANTLKTFAVP